MPREWGTSARSDDERGIDTRSRRNARGHLTRGANPALHDVLLLDGDGMEGDLLRGCGALTFQMWIKWHLGTVPASVHGHGHLCCWAGGPPASLLHLYLGKLKVTNLKESPCFSFSSLLPSFLFLRERWDFGGRGSFLFCGTRGLCILGKFPATRLYPQPPFYFLFWKWFLLICLKGLWISDLMSWLSE